MAQWSIISRPSLLKHPSCSLRLEELRWQHCHAQKPRRSGLAYESIHWGGCFGGLSGAAVHPGQSQTGRVSNQRKPLTVGLMCRPVEVGRRVLRFDVAFVVPFFGGRPASRSGSKCYGERRFPWRIGGGSGGSRPRRSWAAFGMRMMRMMRKVAACN